jgi:hypothetical protein
MTGQNIWRVDVGCSQQQIQIAHDLFDTIIDRSPITPGISSPIVGANPSLLRDFWLDKSPIDRETSAAVLHNYCRRPCTRAVQMQSSPAEIEYLA